MDAKRKDGTMLAPLTIGQRYYIPKAALMLQAGWAIIVATPKPGVYVIAYADGTRETLTDSE